MHFFRGCQLQVRIRGPWLRIFPFDKTADKPCELCSSAGSGFPIPKHDPEIPENDPDGEARTTTTLHPLHQVAAGVVKKAPPRVANEHECCKGHQVQSQMFLSLPRIALIFVVIIITIVYNYCVCFLLYYYYFL